MESRNRFKSWALWVSVAGALWTIAEALGLTVKLGVEKSAFTKILDAVGVILIGFGILNNPTDPNKI